MRKKLIFALAAIALGLAAVEGISFIAIKIIGGEKTTEAPPAAGAAAPILPGVKDPAKLADTIIYNLERNPLTTPDPELIFRVRPNPSGQPVAGYEGINSLGFRGPEPDRPARPGEMKIMIVGDSNGFGWGLPMYEDTWAAKLAARLELKGMKAGIYNLSQPGYSSQQAWRLFDRWFDRIRPDVVIFHLGWNDIWSTPGLTDSQTMRMMSASASPWARAISSTNTYRALKLAVAPIVEYRKRKFAGKAGYGTGETQVRVPPEETVEAFDAMLGKMEAAGAKPVIILPPHSMATPELETIESFNRLVLESFNGRAAMTAMTPMRGDNPRNWTYFIDDGFHANQAGAEVIAGELERVLAAYSTSAPAGLLDGARIFPAFAMPRQTGGEEEDATSLAGNIRVVSPVDPAGMLSFGPYVRQGCASSKAVFRMKTDNTASAPLVTLDAASEEGRKIHVSRTVRGDEFGQPGLWGEFEITFAAEGPIKGLELRALYLGGARLALDTITLACQK